ncbi:MAG: hypothetical protein JRN08_05260 [Nitrososphaerota archaeon]|nr:hypothetical protein [Nitrososphaerota archaeon]
MTTEYEQLLAKMVDDKKAMLAELTGKKGTEKRTASLMSDIRFLEVELQRYQQGMALFRTKSLPKVGRWGKPEAEEKKEEES